MQRPDRTCMKDKRGGEGGGKCSPLRENKRSTKQVDIRSQGNLQRTGNEMITKQVNIKTGKYQGK